MKRAIVCLSLGAMFTPAAWSDETQERAMLARAAADLQPPATQEAPAQDLDAAERQARNDLHLAQARLDLVGARRALAEKQFQRAAELASAAQRSLGSVEGVDVTADDLQAEGILARARQAGVDLRPSPRETPASLADNPGNWMSDDSQLAEQGALHEVVSEDENRRLIEAHAARVAPTTDITYPSYWPQLTAARARYASGQIARSKGWRDVHGAEWYAALYDISDVSYLPPDFTPPFSLFFPEADRNALDREALRQRSEIFNGYAEDLAAGLPLLRYFGGIDEFYPRHIRYNAARRQQVADLVTAFTARPTEPQVISVGP